MTYTRSWFIHKQRFTRRNPKHTRNRTETTNIFSTEASAYFIRNETLKMNIKPATPAWRKEVRSRAIQLRTAIPTDRKREMDNRINRQLESVLLDVLSDCVVGFCWPHKCEFDQRFLAHKLRAGGALTALPIVAQKAHPLVFRSWWPGAAMTRGVFDIPIPVDTPQVEPDVVFPPLNAFDHGGFRLGYGGGYFDRTLASIAPQPVAIGIGYEQQVVDTIYPTEYDVAMDFIVTEAHLYQRLEGKITSVSAQHCSEQVRQLLLQRKLPRAQLDRANTVRKSTN